MRWCASLALLVVLAACATAADPIDFNRQIRPILSAHCFKCHGPDEGTREAGLRLDSQAEATRKLDSEKVAVVPGKPTASELVRRILTTDADELMPPASANKPLSAEQKKLLQIWIEQGAKYAPHWAFVPPQRPAVPVVKTKTWPKNEIDNFILAKLEAVGLQPAPQADKYTLVRRVYLDLIGLPPTPAEADAFVNDTDPKAYEKLIDHLLESPHYGERWARRWLDLARYADTNGYEKDRPRSIWPYRDWVINALNADMPFDQFTIEQLAGDMLPSATPQQRIATGFHRNTMLNEEGGIDPQEFRFYSTVDRTNTTATVWLGLTLGCAQCHTHKFDPIPHHDYYRTLAYFNNADEPEFDVPNAATAERRAEIERQIAALEADPPLAEVPGEFEFRTPAIIEAKSTSGAKGEIQAENDVIFTGETPQKDTYTLTLAADTRAIGALRLEALTDKTLPSQGPGRTPHGNFVVTEIELQIAEEGKEPKPVKLASATADFSQENFPASDMLDGKANTGWAIHGPGNWNVNRTATIHFAETIKLPEKARWVVTLRQDYGMQHMLGKLRIGLGAKTAAAAQKLSTAEVRAAEFAKWKEQNTAKAVQWEVLQPLTATSELPSLTIEPENTIFASGDFSKRDIYDLQFKTQLTKVTAIKLEVLPDARLPKNGPGRVAYEGPAGDFWLSEVSLLANDQKLKWKDASQSFSSGKNNAAAAIDSDPQTGWSINNGQGREHSAVFVLAEPLTVSDAIHLQLLFEKYYAAGLGRFRVWATDQELPKASDLPATIEAILKMSAASRTANDEQRLFKHFLSLQAKPQVEALRKQLPGYTTTLVMNERAVDHPRSTHLHHRGEYLQPKDEVHPQLLSLIGADKQAQPANRLEFARWLVSGKNSLTARVTVNRHWAALFGRGLVRTTDDFGYQGSPPTHPELLDWLALELPQRGWSIKQLHKLILMSATYQQSSRVVPEMSTADPENLLLGRFPRHRVEAELIRDVVLKTSGQLSPKLGGPSVYPPQPAGVTSEGTYGPLAWNVSQGEDRYRRALYTFTKRTAPYAMLLTFDAPSGEACVPRRELSNSPLQALTLLNDQVFLEAAQTMGKQLTTQPGSVAEKAKDLFRRCLTRPPSEEESQLLAKFFEQQRSRLESKELDAAKIAGTDEADKIDRAAWTLTARALLNLDETITKN
ncbi:PSD1 and planctomycete cytochrome C domain-containing protein [Anatilimnocola floriformis]|uniref:PSD1 and planctomycete cytochrome C domain-containing protein n=1 Tax=Anatilimnocola floriformis TaxID=2948575 RepID=UPI0020C5A092|nr:PSD1 and planctomycete cytochrome C domain-containing protein [Anatilimnocola floriformis]